MRPGSRCKTALAMLVAFAACRAAGPTADPTADPADVADEVSQDVVVETVEPAAACAFDAMQAPAVPAAAGTYAIDRFRLIIDANGGWDIRSADAPDRSLFRLPAAGDLAAIAGRLDVDEAQGAFRFSEVVDVACVAAFPATVRSDGANLVLSVEVTPSEGACADVSLEVRACAPDPGALVLEVRATGANVAAVRFRAGLEPDERVFGLGEQFRHDVLDLRGAVVPVAVREQGIGRGEPAVSEVMELLSPGSSGDETTTYAPIPHVLTSRSRSFVLEGDDVAFFDLATPGRIEVRAWAPSVRVRVFDALTPLHAIERLTAFSGRMREPPAWIDAGAIVALAGDLDASAGRLAYLREHGARIAGVWNQTWCGTAATLIGEQVLWNWSLSTSREAAWGAWVNGLDAAGARPLCYVNPMLRDLPADAEPARNLYREAVDAGYVVQAPDGGPYLLRQGVFDVALVDLSNDAARVWMKSVLKDELLGRARCAGWMADFGEALPFDAVLASGEPAAAWHNRYPVEWARLNREVMEEAGVLDATLVFHRSGWTRTPAYSGMQWLGDQTVTWDRYDGLASALHGLLSGGMSGLALNHPDAGGYTVVPLAQPPVERSPELLMRWVELAAFTSLLRTHEGNRPAANAQVYSTDGLADHFARMTRVYAALAPLRRSLYAEAAATGAPVVRPFALHYPDIDRAWDVADAFLLGPDVLVAPVIEPSERPDGAVVRALWLPPGRWRHLWTGTTVDAGDAGIDTSIEARLGEPPVFLREGSAAASSVPAALEAAGVSAGTGGVD